MKRNKFIIRGLCLASIFILHFCSSGFNNSSITQENKLAVEYNQKGLNLINEGNSEKAIEYLNKSLDNLKGYDKFLKEPNTTYKESNELIDAPLNNLSFAYNNLGEYDKSLEYIENSLRILPNTDTEYVNKGNALYGLMDYEKALENYSKAIEKKKNSEYAYYGKGLVYFDTEKYLEALTEFDNYLQYSKDDSDAVLYKVYCHIYLDESEKALEFTNNLINKNKENYIAYSAKGKVLEVTSSYDELKTFYEETAEKFKDNLDAQIKLGEFYYNYGQYNKSLNHFVKLMESYTNNIELHTWAANSHSALGEYDKALEYCDKALKIDNKSPEVFNILGRVYMKKTSYMESINYFDKAIELNPYYEDAFINKLYALYEGKRYSKCIEFGRECEDKFKSTLDIPWFIGDSYLSLNKLNEAVDEYKNCIHLLPENDTLLSSIAYVYLLLEDYNNAKEYVEKSLNINSENTLALSVKNSLEEKQAPIGKQIKEFFYNNYLYNDSSPDLEKNLSTYLEKSNISNKEIAEAIKQVKSKDDIFTFVIHGQTYDYLMKNESNDVEYKNYEEDICYLRLNTFSINTDNRVIEILDNIKDPENKSLVIDLRGNSGGLSKSANNILDTLLPECVTSTLIYKNGYTSSFYSDASQISFKNIYVFVDENSASASELLALGLKTYLKNVTIIGRDTYGKGVGQNVYEDKERKLMVFVVDHYWNVRQTNIMETHITPDIYVKGNNVDDFFKAVNNNK